MPSWGVNDEVIVFSSPVTGNGDIFEYHCAEHRFNILVSTPTMESSPLVSLTGDLFYESKERGTSEIRCKRLSTQTSFSISETGKFDELREVSPDGKQVVVSRYRRSGGLGKLENSVVIEATPVHRVVAELGPARTSFSLDGRRILAVRYDAGASPLVELLNRQGKIEQSLGRADFAKFTGEGHVAIVRDASSRVIDFTNFDGTVQSRITVRAPIELSAYLEPHFAASEVTFISSVGDRREIWRKNYLDNTEERICGLPDHLTSWRTTDHVALVHSRSGSDPRVGSLWRVRYAKPELEFLLELADPLIHSVQ